MRFFSRLRIILGFMLFFGTTFSYAATVDLEAYIMTSGLQPVNTTTQTVNGNTICALGNDNANSYPGCDMSHDTKFNNQGNANAADDVYDAGNDMIVRTGDTFLVRLTVNANGGDVNDFKITSTLQSGVGISWTSLPGVCLATSSISADGLTLECDRDGLLSGQAEVFDLEVSVSSAAANDTDLNAIEFTVSGLSIPNTTADTDTVLGSDDDRLKITASPRWNIDIDYRSKINDYNNSGTMGYLLMYNFDLEVDRVFGVDPAPGGSGFADGYIGSENLGNDFDLQISAGVTSTSPANNSEYKNCIGEDTNYEKYPIGYYISSLFKRSVATAQGVATLGCTQAGGAGTAISIDYNHIDASFSHIPTQNRNEGSLPTYQKIAAIGELHIFVPYSDITATPILTDADGDSYYEVNITVDLSGFDPDSVSGTSNFNGDSESLIDNVVMTTLYYYPDGKAGGSFTKTLKSRGAHIIRNSSYNNDGLGRVVAGGEFVSNIYLRNSGTKDFNNSQICDVIDTNVFRVTKFTYAPTDTPIHVITGANTLHVADINVTYGVGYEAGTWPPPLDQNNSAAVLAECTGTTNTTWYTDFDTAEIAGKITKVMVRTRNLTQGKYLAFNIHHTAMARRLDGSLNHTDTMIPNYTAVYEDVLYSKDADHWIPSEKVLNPSTSGCNVPNNRLDQSADRICMDMADASIELELNVTQATYGDAVRVTTEPAYTTDAVTETIEDNVTVIEVLSRGLTYEPGSSTIGDPVMGDCTMIDPGQNSMRTACLAHPEDWQILVWNLGMRTANVPLDDINYTINIDVRAIEGSGNSVYTEIEAPNTDNSSISFRYRLRSLTVNVPKKFVISKRVTTPFRAVDQSPIEFVTDVKNATPSAVNNMDIIDILPFNGDGTDGFDFTSQTVIHHTRNEPTNYHGTLVFLRADALETCATGGSVEWLYSSRNPRDIDLAPSDSSNGVGGSTHWCAGDEDGPGAGCTEVADANVTAVRLKYTGQLDTDELCWQCIRRYLYK